MLRGPVVVEYRHRAIVRLLDDACKITLQFGDADGQIGQYGIHELSIREIIEVLLGITNSIQFSFYQAFLHAVTRHEVLPQTQVRCLGFSPPKKSSWNTYTLAITLLTPDLNPRRFNVTVMGNQNVYPNAAISRAKNFSMAIASAAPRISR